MLLLCWPIQILSRQLPQHNMLKSLKVKLRFVKATTVNYIMANSTKPNQARFAYLGQMIKQLNIKNQVLSNSINYISTTVEIQIKLNTIQFGVLSKIQMSHSIANQMKTLIKRRLNRIHWMFQMSWNILMPLKTSQLSKICTKKVKKIRKWWILFLPGWNSSINSFFSSSC